MNLFPESDDPEAYCDTLAELVFVGARQLIFQSSNDKRVQYGEWSQAVRTDARNRGINIATEHLEWLWESLRSEPKLQSGTCPPVKVLPKGSRFTIRLRHISSGHGDSSSLPLMPEPEADVEIDDDLYGTWKEKPSSMQTVGCKTHYENSQRCRRRDG